MRLSQVFIAACPWSARFTIEVAGGAASKSLCIAKYTKYERNPSGQALLPKGKGLILLPGVAAIFLVVRVLATLGPARRGLAIQSTDALRAE
jgi:hypothetical protein